MPAIAIIGGQWGDEGKGKVVDLLSEKAEMVIRYSGGNNAGHTVVNSLGEFRMHLIPCGIFHPKPVCIIGNGVVVNPVVLLEELEAVQKAGIAVDGRFYVSDRANLIMPYHILLDGLDEEARGQGAIGTTRMGVGPAYTDKAARLGIRAGDLLDRDNFWKRLSFVMEQKNRVITKLYGANPLSIEEVYETYVGYGQRLAPNIKETSLLAQEALARGEQIILEGAQGTLLDLDFGTYPYVTSSFPIAAGAALGSGLAPTQIQKSLGIFKAYTTRVGGGPFPTELKGEMGDIIRERAQEYGATTGRPRRCGWLDAVAARFSVKINGLEEIALMRLDILDILPSIKICTAYRFRNSILNAFPSSVQVLEECEPICEELPGWEEPISHIRSFKDLPPNAQSYVMRVAELIECPVALLSLGPGREQSIILRPIMPT